jgi:hypothetical protein
VRFLILSKKRGEGNEEKVTKGDNFLHLVILFFKFFHIFESAEINNVRGFHCDDQCTLNKLTPSIRFPFLPTLQPVILSLVERVVILVSRLQDYLGELLNSNWLWLDGTSVFHIRIIHGVLKTDNFLNLTGSDSGPFGIQPLA